MLNLIKFVVDLSRVQFDVLGVLLRFSSEQVEELYALLKVAIQHGLLLDFSLLDFLLIAHLIELQQLLLLKFKLLKHLLHLELGLLLGIGIGSRETLGRDLRAPYSERLINHLMSLQSSLLLICP